MLRYAIATALLLASSAGIGWSRRGLLTKLTGAPASTAQFTLPAPEQTVVLSMGYRAAAADLVFANILVSSGIHVQERRRFEFVGEYLDVVNALDPSFRSPYRFADTLLVLQAAPAREREYKKAREILTRGLKQFPYDYELWLNTGQFLAYLAAPHIADANERAAWRADGGRILARACELAGPSAMALQSCVTAARLLDKAGERDATIRFLERFLALSEDVDLRKMATAYLDRLKAESARQAIEAQVQRFHAIWRDYLPFVSREKLLLLGPDFDAAGCAGSASPENARCATSWQAFWAAQRRAQ